MSNYNAKWADARRRFAPRFCLPRLGATIVALKKINLIAALSLMLLAETESARAEMILWFTPDGATTSDGDSNVSAEANFTLSNDTITLVLTNLQVNLMSAGQEISGIYFDVSGATGSGSLTTVNSGAISTIDKSDGSYSPGLVDSLLRWKATELDTTIHLTTLTGGKPNSLIIGPDDNGGFDPTLGQYSNANPSVSQHNPNVLGTATFTITVPGTTSESQISDVVFEFGTGKPPEPISGVPEPCTLVMLLIAGSLGLTIMWRKWKW